MTTELIPIGGARAGFETFLINPPGLGAELRISIVRAIPAGIEAAPERPAAVVYATDADFLFGTAVDAARIGSLGREVAPAVIVGIGYAEENGDMVFTSSRRILDFYRGPRRDFDAGVHGKIALGGADAFHAALRDHVIPAVERHVAGIDPGRRVLLGASAGGHFAAHALLQDPALFSGYAMMSPVLIEPQPPQADVIMRSRGDGVLVRLVEDLPAGALPPGLRVFLSAGEHEEDPGSIYAHFAINSNALRMRAALARHGVTTRYVQFGGETHMSVTGAAISAALRFLLPVDAPPHPQTALAANSDAKNCSPSFHGVDDGPV